MWLQGTFREERGWDAGPSLCKCPGVRLCGVLERAMKRPVRLDQNKGEARGYEAGDTRPHGQDGNFLPVCIFHNALDFSLLGVYKFIWL